MKRSFERESLQRFLRGEAGEEERLQIEEAFFRDDRLFERLCDLEEEMLDAAPSGRDLSLEESRFRAALKSIAADRQSNRTWGSRLREYPRTPKMVARFAVRAAAAGLLLAAVLAAVWFWRQLELTRSELADNQALHESSRRQLERLDEELVLMGRDNTLLNQRLAEGQRTLEGLRQAQALLERRLGLKLTYLLRAGTVRDESPPQSLWIPPDAEVVVLQFIWRDAARPEDLTVQIADLDGMELWSGKPAASRRWKDGWLSQVEVPAGRLKPDEYFLTLLAGPGGRQSVVERYYFTIPAR